MRGDVLSPDQVDRLVQMLGPSLPIVVGGQAVALLADLHAGEDTILDKLSPLASKDLDVFEDEAAMACLASHLARGRIYRAGANDFTPNAGKVEGWLDDEFVEVDFLRAVKGVDDRDIGRHAVTYGDLERPDLRIRIMHPLDCIRSRLANINDLGRNDDHTIAQADAALRILPIFLRRDLARGPAGRQRVQGALLDLAHVARSRHFGHPTHHEHGARLDPIRILTAFLDEKSLDERWRSLTLASEIMRCRKKEEIETRRREAFTERCSSMART